MTGDEPGVGMLAPAMHGPPPFDVCGRLPTGVTILEASAGTGKTYTIAALAARYVAAGIGLERLLLVTFTRLATGELRERVRERLVSVERGLARAIEGAPSRSGDPDPVVTLLEQGDARMARDRLARALAGFDAATIATTHSFCQEVLFGLGIAGDLEPDVAFAEDLSELVSEVVDDLYVRRFMRGDPPPFDRRQALTIARAAIDNHDAAIVDGDDAIGAMRARLAGAARDELGRRKRAMAVMSYDDLVSRLRAVLEGPRAPAAIAQLRDRFEVVLVDEFQDTDPAQWEIMRRAFGGGDGTLVLIADPKQAIYSFRGADVYAYLDAARAAGTRATLEVNWRSDQPLIDAHDALFAGAELGHAGISYRRVRAAPGHERSRLEGAPVSAALRIRLVGREDPSVSQTPGGYVSKPGALRHIAADLAADVVQMLHSGARIPAQPGHGAPDAPVAPADLAVLVRTNRQATTIRDALHEARVPAVVYGSGSVFDTDSAREWLRLLEALERPASIARARAAALTRLIGWSAERLAAERDDDSPAWEEVHQRLHDWSRVLRARGVASLFEAVTLARTAARDGDRERALADRALAQIGGERRLTDLRHIAQLLHRAASEQELGPSALTGWLRARIADAHRDAADEERSRRLESDAEAVQVLTIHRSKGLEFPIVYLPYLWETPWMPRDPVPVLFHDPAAGDARTLDVSLSGRAYRAHREQHVREQRGEDLRLAYVALTRARHQAVVWWAGSYDSRDSPLGRLLFARGSGGAIAPSGSAVPSDAAMAARLEELARGAGPERISVESARLGAPSAWSPPLQAPAELAAAELERTLDSCWRRTSYTDITAGAHEAWVTSEPEEPILVDEPSAALASEAAPPLQTPAEDAPLALADAPAGVQFGTFVHLVMQATDFAAGDLDVELATRIAEARGRAATPIAPEAALVAGLRAVIETPLGPLFGGARLRDVARADRLDELAFELPLAGGDRPSGTVSPERIAAVLAEHLDERDPLAGYPERLTSDRALRHNVRGYLTGSIDLVVRIGGRFALLDYKTNRLAAPGEPLTVANYGPDALRADMIRHHYALQALLYTVALHRYLRWRLRGYDPARDLAGVAYLFVRGMPDAGVFSWAPPPELVTALDDALDGVR
ncbi:MAG: UvrD-helicase domain-containing protein [Solirubrobacteraceae bacterium]